MNIKLSILIASIPSRFHLMQDLYNRLLNEVQDLPIEIICFIDNKKRSIGKKRESLVQIAKGEYVSFIDDDEDFFQGYAKKILEAISISNADVICFNQKATINGKSFLVDFSRHNENENARLITIAKYNQEYEIPENYINYNSVRVSNSQYNLSENILDEEGNEKKVNLIFDLDHIEDNVYMDEKNERIYSYTKSFNYTKEKQYINIKRPPFHICAWKSDIAKTELLCDVGYGEDWDWCERLLKKVKTHYKIEDVLHHYIFNDKVSEAPFENLNLQDLRELLGEESYNELTDEQKSLVLNYTKNKNK